MQFKKLGKSDLEVSTICFGCGAAGKMGWGNDVTDENSIASIHRALDIGINFFDTADVYGNGHSEEVLANALGSRRNEVIIATKVGNRRNEKGEMYGDLSRDHILQSLDNSLKRLNREVIDLYQVHRPDDNTPIQETMETLLHCVESGKIRYIGLSNQTSGQIQEYLNYGGIVSFQPPLSLLYRYVEVELLPFCQENQIGVIPYNPLGRGLLTGKYSTPVQFPEKDFRRNYFLFANGAFEHNIKIVQTLKRYAEALNCAVAQLAIAWVLAHPSVTSAIVGAKRPSQIEETSAAFEIKLTHEELKKIDRILMNPDYDST